MGRKSIFIGVGCRWYGAKQPGRPSCSSLALTMAVIEPASFCSGILASNAKTASRYEFLYRVCVCHKVNLSTVWRNMVMLAVVGSSQEEGFIVTLSWGRWVYGLLPVWAQRCSPWGSKPINIQVTVPRGDAFAKALSVFTPWRRLTSPPTTSSLHPPASQQFLACSSPVFVEPSQWEVGGRNIPYSPVDWSWRFICSGTDFGLVKHTHISVDLPAALLCLCVSLCECALWPVRCYSTCCVCHCPLTDRFLTLSIPL